MKCPCEYILLKKVQEKESSWASEEGWYGLFQQNMYHLSPTLAHQSYFGTSCYIATSRGFCIPGSCICSNESNTSWTQSTNKTVIQLTLSVWGQKSPPSLPPENDLCIGFFTFSILKPSYSFKKIALINTPSLAPSDSLGLTWIKIVPRNRPV